MVELAFQADSVGSIPITRSGRHSYGAEGIGFPDVQHVTKTCPHSSVGIALPW